jgi:transcriptional pleiotropic regulator of transition state genes
MKSTGMTRKVDELGRIVLPAEIRQTLNIHTKDALEIFTEADCIVLKKYVPGCTFCTGMEGIVEFEGKRICSACLERLKSL